MANRKADKAAKPGKGAPKAKGGAPRAKAAGAPAPDGDAELLAQLLQLQERTAAVGKQIRAIGELVTTVTREATITAAEIVEQMGAAADAESAEPPPVAARPRRRRPPAG